MTLGLIRGRPVHCGSLLGRCSLRTSLELVEAPLRFLGRRPFRIPLPHG